MLAIKLKTAGRRNQRTFRVIVQEARSKLGGKFVEDIGWYNPHTNQIKIDRERADYWLKNGAQPTKTAEKILSKVDSSEAVTYEVREGRKNKGKKKIGGAAPEVSEGTASAEGAEGAEESATQVEAAESAAAPDTAETPAPEAAEIEAAPKEETTQTPEEKPTEGAEPQEDKEAKEAVEEDKQNS